VKKPCDNCTVNAEQYDEGITCFKTCKDWKEWDKRRGKEIT